MKTQTTRIQIAEPCREAGCISNARMLEMLRHRQMERHSQESKKWKNSSYYFEQKCKKLELEVLEMRNNQNKGMEKKDGAERGSES